MNTRDGDVRPKVSHVRRIRPDFRDLPFDELLPGVTARTDVVLTEEVVGEYVRLGGGVASDVVPPSVYCTFLPMFSAMGGRMEQGTVHVGHRIDAVRAVRVGTTLTAEVAVTEAVEERDRRRVVVETRFLDGDAVVCTSTGTYFWGHASR